MKSSKTRTLYRVTFHNQGNIYEIYARKVGQGDLYAFVEVEGLVFGERSQVVVDPSEERLKAEFAGVTRFHIPLPAVIRIDEVEKGGVAKILPAGGEAPKVTPFPGNLTPPGHKS
jgi:hypothetical protein